MRCDRCGQPIYEMGMGGPAFAACWGHPEDKEKQPTLKRPKWVRRFAYALDGKPNTGKIEQAPFEFDLSNRGLGPTINLLGESLLDADRNIDSFFFECYLEYFTKIKPDFTAAAVVQATNLQHYVYTLKEGWTYSGVFWSAAMEKAKELTGA